MVERKQLLMSGSIITALVTTVAILTMEPSGSVLVERSITLTEPSIFQVVLAVDIDETQNITGLIIKDWAPLGWNVTSSNPPGHFNYTSGLIKWVLYGGTLIDQNITYTVQIPNLFRGEAITLNETVNVTGEMNARFISSLEDVANEYDNIDIFVLEAIDLWAKQ